MTGSATHLTRPDDQLVPIQRSSSSGSTWVVVAIAAGAIAQMGLLVALGRILSPNAFGVAAGALALLAGLRMLLDSILPAALIQKPKLTSETARTAATLAVGISLAVSALLWLAAPGIEALLRLDGLTSWLRWLVPAVLIHSITVAPQAMLVRELRFRLMALIEAAAMLGGYLGVGVAAVLLDVGPPILGFAFAAEGVVRLAFLRPRRTVLPTLGIDLDESRALLGFTGPVGLGSALNLAANRGDYFVVSRLLGAVSLGAYTQAYQLAFNPGLLIGRAASRWLFPVLSRVQHDPHLLRAALAANISMIGWLSATAGVAIFVMAPEIVEVLFGAKWEATVEPLRILSFAVPARVLSTVCDGQVKASGRVRERTKVQAFYALAVLSMTALGATVSLRWASVGLVIAVILAYGGMLRLASDLSLRSRKLVRAHLYILAAGVVASALLIPAVWVTRSLSMGSLVVLIVGTLITGLMTLVFAALAKPRLAALGASLNEAIPPPEAKPEEDPSTPEASERLAHLIDRLTDAGVTAVAFKGRGRLDHAMTGSGDLDLFVAPSQTASATAVLADTGFRSVPNASWRDQSGLTDWFGADTDGSLLHVQLYDRLHLGPVQGPDVELPYPNNLVAAASNALPGAEPAAASDAHGHIVRLCSAALTPRFGPGKTRRRALARARELGAGISMGDLTDGCVALFGDKGLAPVLAVAAKGGSSRGLRRHLLTHHRSPGGNGRRYRSVATAVLSGLNRKILARSNLPRRRLQPAPVVAVIGSDGSGKSTLTKRLVAELNTKIDARHVYFGTGDGSSSLLRRPLIILRRLWDRRRPSTANGPSTPITGPSEAPSTRTPPEIARIAWAITTLRERQSKMRRVRKAANRGVVIVTDRYPQAEYPGIFDGPRLAGRPDLGRAASRVASWEKRGYANFAAEPPDLVLLLDVPHKVAMGRRPDEHPAELERRIALARVLSFDGARRVTIDASSAADDVLAQALAAVLDEIGRR